MNIIKVRFYIFIKVLSGTTLSIADVMTLKISAFKKEEIVVITPVNPFGPNEIKKLSNIIFQIYKLMKELQIDGLEEDVL